MEASSPDNCSPFPLMEPARLASILDGPTSWKTVLLLDTRSFFEYSEGCIRNSVHMPCSNIMKRRLLTDKVKCLEILHLTADCLRNINQVVVYDAASFTVDSLCQDSFTHIALTKLRHTFPVFLLKGGYGEFSKLYPDLCVQCEEKEKGASICSAEPSCPKEALMNCGPTQIFSHLYLGSERDALSLEVMKTKGITHVLNVSSNCPKADYISESHFMRIAVNDTYSDKLICHFMKAFAFLDEVKKNNGCALIHCLAGVSRSPTLAIAYVMKCKNISYDEAYRYVKEKRPSISPNLNFLGQLVEFDRTENEHRASTTSTTATATRATATLPLSEKCSAQSQFLTSPCKRQRLSHLRNASQNAGLKLNLADARQSAREAGGNRGEDISPGTLISRLSLTSPTV